MSHTKLLSLKKKVEIPYLNNENLELKNEMSNVEYKLTKDEALSLYKKMVLTRKTEELHEDLYRNQTIPVYPHSGFGQEATGCGVSFLLKEDDYLLGTHRGVAEFVGKGLSVEDIFLEYTGKSNSISGGWAGLHLFSRELNILPLLSGLGTDFSLGVGVGLSLRNKGSDSIIVEYFGEGAAEQTDFHGALNMAVIYELPIIFCCCTNQFVELHSYRETTCVSNIASRAEGYGIQWKIVENGNDMMAVGSAIKEAIILTRKNKCPYFLEFKTYRVKGHHLGDTVDYDDSLQKAEAIENDPIKIARQTLIAGNWATDSDFDQIDKACDKNLEDAVKVLNASKLPHES